MTNFMNSTNLTKLEKEVIVAITKDTFYSNLDDGIWVDTFLEFCPIETNVLKGTLGSLKKKGIILMGGNNVLGFTEEAFDLVKEVLEKSKNKSEVA